jgi:hypothetical protein
MRKQFVIFIILVLLIHCKLFSQKYIDSFYISKLNLVSDVINKVRDSVKADIKSTYCLVNTYCRRAKLKLGFAYNGIEFTILNSDNRLLKDLRLDFKRKDVILYEYNTRYLFRPVTLGSTSVFKRDSSGKPTAGIYLEINSPLESWENLEVLFEVPRALGDINLPRINEIFSKKLSLPVYVYVDNNGVITRENRIYMYEYTEDKKFKFIQMLKY